MLKYLFYGECELTEMYKKKSSSKKYRKWIDKGMVWITVFEGPTNVPFT